MCSFITVSHLLAIDMDIPSEDVTVFKSNVVLVTNLDDKYLEYVKVLANEIEFLLLMVKETPKIDQNVPVLSQVARYKFKMVHAMTMPFDQNYLTQLESADDDLAIIRLLMDCNLLSFPSECPNEQCRATDSFHLQHSTHYVSDHACFRCMRCERYYSVREHSFFAKHHLTLVMQLSMSTLIIRSLIRRIDCCVYGRREG
jgi:hypothetical protein